MKSTIENILAQHIPLSALDYAVEMYRLGNFTLKITKDRQTKLGDYSFDPHTQKHTITVNNGLNQYAFLITYIHEVAHLVATIRHGTHIKPHGEEWQSAYKEVLFPLLKPTVFPEALLIALFKHLNRPKASSCADITLQKVLHQYDEHAVHWVFVEDFKLNERFQHKEKIYKVEKIIKTRLLCIDEYSQKKYLFPKAMKVKRIED
jgi:hypothetical protein